MKLWPPYGALWNGAQWNTVPTNPTNFTSFFGRFIKSRMVRHRVRKSDRGLHSENSDSLMVRHPGQTLTIYNMAELVGQAFEKSMTPCHIKSGFKKTGIFPFDRDVFMDV